MKKQNEFKMNPKRQQELERKLSQGLKQMQLELAFETRVKLLSYLELLLKWNRVHNLVGPCSAEEALSRHFLDSLSVNPFLQGETILDLGTGGGFPGLVLAIANSDKKFILLDSNTKKINFVQHVVVALKLTNVEVVRERAETYQLNPKADTVVTRAVASLTEFLQLAEHLGRAGGLFVAMKGKADLVLQQIVPQGFGEMNLHQVKVPGVVGERHIVVVKKV